MMRSFNKLLFTVISLFGILLLFYLYGRPSQSDFVYLEEQLRGEVIRLQSKVSDSEKNVEQLKMLLSKHGVKENEVLAVIQYTADGSFRRDVPQSRELLRDYPNDQSSLDDFQQKVTILIYSNLDNQACTEYQIKDVRKKLPKITIIFASPTSFSLTGQDANMQLLHGSTASTEGTAINSMISKVKTPYFVYLSEGATVSEFLTDNGPGWLLHALERVPEIDFIGGAMIKSNKSLRYDQFEVQCYRMKMCYYTFTQKYQYKYSVGDSMICEETSSSFMGRLSSLAKVGSFDETLNSMVTTDFFWRAKGRAIVALRPEVFFHIKSVCEPPIRSKSEMSLLRQAFMEKYELVRIKDSYGFVTNFPDSPHKQYSQSIWGRPFSYVKDGGFASPFMTQTLRDYVKFFDTFFRTQNITYFCDAGMTLGSLKMRNVLPWDTGDVDAGYYGVTWQKITELINKYCKEKNINCNLVSSNVNFLHKQKGMPTSGLKSIGIKFDKNYGAHYDIYPHNWEATPRGDQFMYIMVNGVDVPVHKELIKEFRVYYGINYLEMAGKRVKLRCKRPGHHACVPDAFSHGGGHWREFYCDDI